MDFLMARKDTLCQEFVALNVLYLDVQKGRGEVTYVT